MGIGNYFKANKKGGAPQPIPQSAPQMSEKAPPGFTDNMELRTPMSGTSMTNTPRYGSSRASLAPSTRSSTFVDDIKHEVMCNYLYQQQCSHLWVSDGSGELEGIILRKAKHNYIACPPQLVESQFARACAALNVQVGFPIYSSERVLITCRLP